LAGVAAPARRRLVLASSDQHWGERWLLGQLDEADLSATLWIAERAPAGVQAIRSARVTQCLGSEYRLLVCNAHQGFHPDAVAAAAGTLRGGGDCVLLIPPLETWSGFADPDKARFAAYPRALSDMNGGFLARLLRCWREHPATQTVTPSSPLTVRLAPAAVGSFQPTDAQWAAVAAVERVAHGHARRPLVLTADRGRGKSTVLGIAAARLLIGGLPRITVVAPHRAAAETLFRHALAEAGIGPRAPGDVRVAGGTLRFRLPAECIDDADGLPGLLLVDEAAAIPVGVLQRLLEVGNRLVFASTVHGYEGSGRGFDIRFRALLSEAMPQWRGLHLKEPLRWASDDPLEAALNRGFLLDVELTAPPAHAALSIQRVEPAVLAGQESLLRSTFALLVNAHYQTRPSDLRQLLDNPDVHLWLASRGDVVVGVLLCCAEGGFDPGMAEQVLSGRRRPRGHLLAQSLAVHAGLDEVLGQRVLRVQRIAVHPQMRREGLGRGLLDVCAAWAEEHRFDLLGCAFAADSPLLGFWRALHFTPARLGARVDPASAAHSLFLLHGLSVRGGQLADRARRQFLAGLPWSLAASLSEMDSHLAVLLLRGRICDDLGLSAAERRGLTRVACGARQPATVESALWKALVQLAAEGRAAPAQLAPLLARWLQQRTSDRVCRTYGLDGRRALEGRLRELLLEHQMSLV
jgi:tRNA(Met) cytidine acetyltransferase